MSLPLINNSLVSYNNNSPAQRCIKLLEEKNELKTELEAIKKELETTRKELEQLKGEFEENTIINSMNDMKKSYEIQEKKIEKLKNYIEEIYNYTRTAKTMISVVSINISDYTSMRSFRQELRTRLEFITEMLDISLKRKSELLYLEYDTF